MALSINLGFPRIGRDRELKRATEGYWAGKVSADELASVCAQLRREQWEEQRNAGIELIPSNSFSLYDQILDTTAQVLVLCGIRSNRYRAVHFIQQLLAVFRQGIAAAGSPVCLHYIAGTKPCQEADGS